MSVTISITIPEQLEDFFQKQADDTGISRSRAIGNVLLAYQKRQLYPIKNNDCARSDHLNYCSACAITCRAPQSEADTCPEYLKGGTLNESANIPQA